MISIDEALQLIRRHARSLPARQMELASLAGHRLAEPVVSDVDSPPFDKAMMDGVAIRAADFADGIRDYECVGEILAGGTSELTLGPGQAIRIMTGAPVPDGANAVVMVEETVARQRDGRPFVELTSSHCVSGQNILRRRETMAVGQSIFGPGHLVRAHDTGVMAEAGVVQAQVIPRPGLAVIATGDELVSVDSIPINSQIRNSNGPMVAAMAGPWCRDVADLGIAPDDGVRLASLISQGLQSSVLVLSGGVSAGAADLVPQVLADAGVQQIFHKVAIKPGKPIWFGQLTRDPDPPTLVFGLPGNPVIFLFGRRCSNWPDPRAKPLSRWQR